MRLDQLADKGRRARAALASELMQSLERAQRKLCGNDAGTLARIEGSLTAFVVLRGCFVRHGYTFAHFAGPVVDATTSV